MGSTSTPSNSNTIQSADHPCQNCSTPVGKNNYRESGVQSKSDDWFCMFCAVFVDLDAEFPELSESRVAEFLEQTGASDIDPSSVTT